MLLLLRRLDLIMQVLIGTLMVIVIPLGGIMLFVPSLQILSVLQWTSAALNTHASYRAGYKKEILIYGSLAMFSAVTVVPAMLPSLWQMHPLPAWVTVIGFLTSVCIVVYYCIIYHKLIDHHALRNELSGFTKSKF